MKMNRDEVKEFIRKFRASRRRVAGDVIDICEEDEREYQEYLKKQNENASQKNF